jgi:hypothetical protein
MAKPKQVLPQDAASVGWVEYLRPELRSAFGPSSVAISTGNAGIPNAGERFAREYGQSATSSFRLDAGTPP